MKADRAPAALGTDASMACVCPRCGSRFVVELDDPITQREQVLRDTCVERGLWVSSDGRVTPATAAQLLVCAPKTLANMRTQRCGPRFQPVGIGRGHVSYELRALAEYLVQGSTTMDSRKSPRIPGSPFPRSRSPRKLAP